LHVGDGFIQFSENGVNVKNSYGRVVFDKEFWRQYCDIFIVVFALIVHEGSREKVGCGVGLPWDVLDLELIVL